MTIKGWIVCERIWWMLNRQWKRARKMACMGHVVGDRALIIPCDPWAVVGSRGDQAMVLACVQQIRASHPDRAIDIMTDDTSTHDACRAIGLSPQATWPMPMDKWFAQYGGQYAEVYILGADVTDGVYGWPTACKLLAYYDIFSAVHLLSSPSPRVHYLGFSWSTTPDPMMRRVMRHLSKGLPLPVRDPVSRERVAAFTRHGPLVQVADAAFCMQPRVSNRVVHHRSWAEAQHAAGKRVVALNVHTMFNEAETKSADWERTFVDVLKRVQAERPDIQYLFLPHDNRPRVSDHAILKRLYQAFDASCAYLVDEVMDADEIKALVGICDGLIAGRMHISIGALGMGVPVFGLVYQGKFEGLWQHFGLSDDTLISPRVFLDDPGQAGRRILAYLDALPTLRKQIADALPHVLTLSKKNFETSIVDLHLSPSPVYT